MRHGRDGDAAFAELQTLWQANPKSDWELEPPQTHAQCEFIHNWSENGGRLV